MPTEPPTPPPEPNDPPNPSAPAPAIMLTLSVADSEIFPLAVTPLLFEARLLRIELETEFLTVFPEPAPAPEPASPPPPVPTATATPNVSAAIEDVEDASICTPPAEVTLELSM